MIHDLWSIHNADGQNYLEASLSSHIDGIRVYVLGIKEEFVRTISFKTSELWNPKKEVIYLLLTPHSKPCEMPFRRLESFTLLLYCFVVDVSLKIALQSNCFAPKSFALQNLISYRLKVIHTWKKKRPGVTVVDSVQWGCLEDLKNFS